MDESLTSTFVKSSKVTGRLTFSLKGSELDKYARVRLRNFVEKTLGYVHVAVGQYAKENVSLADLQRDADRFIAFHSSRQTPVKISNFEITAPISGTLSIRPCPSLEFDELRPLDDSRLLMELSRAA